jgi:hypothetical protein
VSQEINGHCQDVFIISVGVWMCGDASHKRAVASTAYDEEARMKLHGCKCFAHDVAGINGVAEALVCSQTYWLLVHNQ